MPIEAKKQVLRTRFQVIGARDLSKAGAPSVKTELPTKNPPLASGAVWALKLRAFWRGPAAHRTRIDTPPHCGYAEQWLPPRASKSSAARCASRALLRGIGLASTARVSRVEDPLG